MTTQLVANANAVCNENSSLVWDPACLFLQKRKTLRESIAMQRRLKANGLNEQQPCTVSLSVEALPRSGIECDLRQRTLPPRPDDIRLASTPTLGIPGHPYISGGDLPDMIV